MNDAHFIEGRAAPSGHAADDTVFVLVGTSHPGNVGAAARALKNMGFGTLRLVAPRYADVLTQPETLAFASGAEDVLASAQVLPELSAAVEDCGVVVALSARVRDFGPPLHTPEWLPQLSQRSAEQGRRVAFVFGSERFGLSNADVYRCDALLSIPANPAYTSLNLAQAVQVIAWEWRKAVGLHAVQPAQAEAVAATAGEVRGMLEHVEQALLALEVPTPVLHASFCLGYSAWPRAPSLPATKCRFCGGYARRFCARCRPADARLLHVRCAFNTLPLPFHGC